MAFITGVGALMAASTPLRPACVGRSSFAPSPLKAPARPARTQRPLMREAPVTPPAATADPPEPVVPTPAAAAAATAAASAGAAIPHSSAAPSGDPPLSGRTPRTNIRIAIPSKGGMSAATTSLLRDVGMDVQMLNPRQYVASLRNAPGVEVWLQRPPDIVRKVRDGDVDLGFVGYDLVSEHGGGDGQVVIAHEDLGYGGCRLSIGVPMAWAHVSSVAELAAVVNAPGAAALRVATKFPVRTREFFQAAGMVNYEVVKMDGALEASTQMGTADVIVDLVSSGVTLRENLLKEIDGGTLVTSAFQMVGNRASLAATGAPADALRSLCRELLERIDAHLMGKEQCNVIANIRGSSMNDVARRLGAQTDLCGMDGPTINSVVPPRGTETGMYAIGLVVPKDSVYRAIKQLRSVGGSGVCVLPVTYVFEQESKRWNALLQELGSGVVE
ncbi:hypothetical protein BU14_0307s0015 [Porphyra umbilicalis]|uniref:ATP phosphoribosyltransferase n=1 Tax=Porphyra umbilicalis TaxID=2786 RepID=A0A1X6NZT6_PORUM|nr:hypothetical protein BU14_0307s0015 [Porphyra umbilicalis]|eukprot:OSX74112.1 hypothetical protein BU14_0307s0015 [Porphyra umbilicalis]